ncbi:AAA domain-containing protein [Podospora fimiseda]|uniref:AAA domain-containing protein n=1 Tax=Podospora fimiseda TaxID=252190 RepID=A0AAN7BF00_9PEZI|nr:AAA domain-containing protein [Podospora fimiseda]
MSLPPNIYIVGAQCTGKTTLINNLRQHFQSNSPSQQFPPPTFITEVARSVLKTHSFTASDVIIPSRSLQLQHLILLAQASAERECSTQWFISDRSGADPIAYALRYVGAEETNKLLDSDEWTEIKDRMKKGVLIVCEASEEAASWLHNDGVRLMPKDISDWVAFHTLFCDFLDKHGIEHVVLPPSIGEHEARVEFVLRYWKSKFQSGST